MRYIKCSLPQYPVSEDMWDALANESRPIVVYGMGNGADKLIERFNEYGIIVSDFFASDGFVRGHSFHGMRVKSFSEIKETYSDFVIVLSFASNRSEVIDMLSSIDREYDMYVPDMPVAGEEYFDRDFYNLHYEEIRETYEIFADDDSKNAYANIINYKLFGRMSYLMNAYSDKDELYDEISSREVITYVDAGQCLCIIEFQHPVAAQKTEISGGAADLVAEQIFEFNATASPSRFQLKRNESV